jgi:ATP-binding cassette ChvD family protein
VLSPFSFKPSQTKLNTKIRKNFNSKSNISKNQKNSIRKYSKQNSAYNQKMVQGLSRGSNVDVEKLRKDQRKEENSGTIKKRSKGYGMPGKLSMSVQNIDKLLPDGTAILKNVTLSFFYGAKVGILGLNGAGKSTLLRIMAGEDTDFDGEVNIYKDYKIGFLHQEPELDYSKTVKENIEDGVAEKLEILQKYNELKNSGKTNTPKFRELENIVRDKKLAQLESNISRAMYALRTPPPESEVENLSGGEKRRVALCRLLISEPDILFLDEPTNHLDAESVAWLERFLDEYQGTVLAVTHDRYFLDNVAGWILEIDRGKCIPYEGNYSDWLVAKQTRLLQEEKSQKSLIKRLKEEQSWIGQTPKARQLKSKARIERYNVLRDSVLNRKYESGTIMIPPGPRLGNQVIDAKDLTYELDDGRVLIKDFSFSLSPGAIVGVVGPNGSGKSTLLNIITGKKKPTSGSIKIGETVQLAMIDQMRDLHDANSVFDEIAQGQYTIDIGENQIPMRQYVTLFSFKGGDQEKLVSALSGGERNRVHIAKILKTGANILLLDEPTNDVDVEVLRTLEEGLNEFPGCVIIVSHDRWFLDKLATHIIAFEGDGSVVWFEGNYQSYEKDKIARLGDTRFKFKRLKKGE